ncbi:hypothetical protein Poli38472_001699 [Pythium oligandrum]|uniref:isoleucine--tRNA ligase n=1 Tax=Pythium oligandrum TaxID=41045 RepID=A0A8K1CV67_PYTOL|nr:hypothetical protein Poli38472_001699 [Pythium oligandrum]|eukprot:TMW69543.1 hypothetical protein Poli38472_001699 [Pythium oligandrum]
MAAATEAKKLAEAMRKTLNLPQTAFPMRANAAVRETELHARCVTYVYETQRQLRQDAEAFVLHDGPPFANGTLHMGHFLNKVLKDIINRYKLMRGYRIEYVPGWDCHGLPIEMKALEKLKTEQSIESLTPSEVRKLSRELATGAMLEQKKDFERWGVMADWSGAPGSFYVTMEPAYEAKQYDVLKKMVEDDLVFRGFKPVYWSPSSQTALAESELEYTDNHVSHAAYIAFPFHSASTQEARALLEKYGDSLSCVIWTTTPWTIPANQALCVNAQFEYAIVRKASTGQHFLVASELVDKFVSVIHGEGDAENDFEVVDHLAGNVLQGSLFSHPLTPERKSVVLLGEHVTADAGTGIVHTAPGHGQDDYFAWIQYHQQVQGTTTTADMEILCPVDGRGHFTREAGESLEGLDVLSDGSKRVIEQLTESNKLLHVSKFKHRYPYDWRTKKPVILRATAQWFARLDTLHAVGKRVLEEEVETFPKNSRRRLEATLASRNEWCISRQRAWGLPIPVFYHKETDEPLINAETIAHLQEVVRNYKTGDGRQGSDCWWDLSVKDLLPSQYADVSEQYVKGMDTLDVWFDSGSSWHAVLPDPAEKNTRKQANVYLEGSDQHRGWFQSSLLTSVAMQQSSPYKHLITHGFTLDERGSKMSKSLGNTIVPSDFIDGGEILMPGAKKPKAIKIPAYGADVLRFWVASTDYTGEVSFGPTVISKVSDSLRKVRNTARFLLANLHDFQPDRHAIKYEDLTGVDKYMLHVLQQLGSQVTESYDTYAFNRVQSALSHFIATDLSAFYMEACKDRLYCDGTDSTSRRASQTVLWLTLQTLSRAIAPVVCHTAEDIRLHWMSQVLQCPLEDVQGSIFTDDAWLPSAPEWDNEDLARQWTALRQLRLDVNRVVEKMRGAEGVGSQLECNVHLFTNDANTKMLLEQELSSLENVLLCSGVELAGNVADRPQDAEFRGECLLALGDTKSQVEIVVTRAKGHKCPRCWKYAVEVDAEETKLCHRCAQATQLSSVEDLARALVQD